MNDGEFDFITRLVKTNSGVVITRDKSYLLESHLLPLARSLGFHDLSRFIRFLETNADEKLVTNVVEAMTNNESMFFRDIKPFEHIRKILLPRLQNSRAKGSMIRIWSAACATGQEPYSVAICLLEEAVAMVGFNYEIIATDIAPKVLAKARQGIYTQFEMQRGMSEEMLPKYFDQLPDGNWQAKDILRQLVTFGRQNLLEDIIVPGKFDIILCRNVMIYFDEPTRRAIVEKISLMMNPGGVLLLGSAETLANISDKYGMLDSQHGLYVLQ